MALPVFFQMYLISPYSKNNNAAMRNRQNTFYIGKRPGVELNDGMAHGLFGKVGDKEFGAIEDIEAAANHIRDKTRSGTNMYRCILSLEENDAVRLGYDKRKQWEELLEQNIIDIASQIPVPPSSLRYVAAVHMEKGHPHMHFTFWDENQGVRITRVRAEETNKTRIKLTKRIFKEELEELHQIKNEARESLLENIDGFFGNFMSGYLEMTDEEIFDMVQDLEANPELAKGKLLNKKFDPEFLQEFSDMVFSFKDKLPQKGRLNYGFLPEEQKKEAQAIIEYLLKNNNDFERQFERYVTVSVDIASKYSTNKEYLENAKNKAKDDLTKRLSNKLIEHLKKQLKEESEHEKEKQSQERASAYRRTSTIKLLAFLYDELTREYISKERKAWIWKKNNLSKEARREIAMKLQDKSGLDWGQYENY